MGFIDRMQEKADALSAKAAEKVVELDAKHDALLTDENGWMSFPIHEDGRNGVVKVAPGRLIRTVKKGIAKQDDTVLVKYDSIQSLRIERKLGLSSVVVSTAVGDYRWKVSAAEKLKSAIEEQMFA